MGDPVWVLLEQFKYFECGSVTFEPWYGLNQGQAVLAPNFSVVLTFEEVQLWFKANDG